ncbi:hypothetical protein G7Z99_08505 [Pseudomonas entomophila]|uniref:hypothetical protein n=1 Tax=Pseudomonas entomophila TaxID=312306 RepID=UPI0015E2B482|nr:hypothetical protein [Pseudomonas entomophila]MBA1189088.1 hypothetical protein [Pseudomonas entomophila]
MKPAKRSAEKYFKASNATFIVLGCVISLCVLGYGYEWVRALLSGVHEVYIRGRPPKTFSLDASATAYWLSMLFEALRIALLMGTAWLSFFAARLFRQ